MDFQTIIIAVADSLKAFDSEQPTFKQFQPGIGPFGEPQIVSIIAQRLSLIGIPARTRRTPDLDIQHQWAIEFKIVRPFGNNGKVAENWSVNMLHPYPGNTSLIGDAIKLTTLNNYLNKGLFVIGFEHAPPKISLDPLLDSFEAIARHVLGINLGDRIEQKRDGLVHPEHQVLRCVGWQIPEK